MEGVVAGLDACVRELTLFAAVMLAIGGIDDLLVDLVFLGRRLRHGRQPLPRIAPPAIPGRIAVFVPAWAEANVIGDMLRATLARLRHRNFRVYVGCYPNDLTTIDAVASVAETDDRVRLVIGRDPGPTTKAANLNQLWRALCRADAAEGERTRAVVIHDAEDLVHPDELGVHDALIGVADVVQLPVVPLAVPGSAFVSGQYLDEFAHAHGAALVVRTALKAGLPLAGTGCSISTGMLERIAASRGGEPFDADSLTEDYELGLRIAEMGGQGAFARVAGEDGSLVAVRAYFPATVGAAVRQKARWMTGIALAGWDRTGWSRGWAIGDHWMRMRDRRAPLATLVIAVAYLAMLGWGLSAALHQSLRLPGVAPGVPAWLLGGNVVLLLWRLAVRARFTGGAHGWREGMLAVPRLVVGNYVALLAARRAVAMYWRQLRGEPARWDKTRHDFPLLAGEAS